MVVQFSKRERAALHAVPRERERRDERLRVSAFQRRRPVATLADLRAGLGRRYRGHRVAHGSRAGGPRAKGSEANVAGARINWHMRRVPRAVTGGPRRVGLDRGAWAV